MKNTAQPVVSETDALKRNYQELSAKNNEVFLAIGKKYYELNKDNPSSDFTAEFGQLKDSVNQLKQIDTRLKFLSGIVICTNCGMENGVKSSFCLGCGTRLPHTYAADGANRCPNCGNVVTPGQKFCGTCGSAVDITPAAAPAPEEVEAFAPAPEVVPEAAPEAVTPVAVPTAESVSGTISSTPVAPAKRFCPNCGCEVAEADSVFCAECGTKLD